MSDTIQPNDLAQLKAVLLVVLRESQVEEAMEVLRAAEAERAQAEQALQKLLQKP